MAPVRTPDEQIAAFRTAIQKYEDGVRDRIGASVLAESNAAIRRAYGGKLPNEHLADALDGLDLAPSEWRLLEWFLSWDSQDTLASIITKARAQGPAADVTAVP